MPEFINLTSHPVHIYAKDDLNRMSLIASFPERGKARVLETRIESPDSFVVINGFKIPVVSKDYGQVLDLPAPRKETYFIVSGMVKKHCPLREDLLVPTDAIRDVAGRIIGCRSFT
jgi:hypothetical protein